MSISYDPPAYSAQPGWASGRSARVSAGDAVFATVGSVLLAAIVCGLPIALHLTSQLVAIGVCVVLALIAVIAAPATVPAVLVFPYLFQNLFVALVSPTME